MSTPTVKKLTENYNYKSLISYNLKKEYQAYLHAHILEDRSYGNFEKILSFKEIKELPGSTLLSYLDVSASMELLKEIIRESNIENINNDYSLLFNKFIITPLGKGNSLIL